MSDTITYPLRLNRYLALQGLASRREADELIASGAVRVNGRPATLGMKIIQTDKVEVSGQAKSAAHYYFIYHKPEGEEMKERYQAPGAANLFPLGRLDKASRGLLLLTNDRRLTGRLLSPEHGHEREYVVTVNKHLSPSFARLLGRGIKIEKSHTQPAKVEILDDRTFKIALTEGKKHQIRRMCAALGCQVTDLLRTRIMDLRLGTLKPGTSRSLRPVEKEKLLSSLGLDQ